MIGEEPTTLNPTKVHVNVGVNCPLVPARGRSVPAKGAREGRAIEHVRVGVLNRISITRITVADRHIGDALVPKWDRDIGLPPTFPASVN
jgi:hypothetical protein